MRGFPTVGDNCDSLFVKAKLHDFGNIIISSYAFKLMHSDGHFQ